MSGILNSKVNIWMTDSRLLKYQSLLEGRVTKLKVRGNLNLPLSFSRRKIKHLITIVPVSNFKLCSLGRPDDIPLDNPDMEIFTDGSSFVQDGKNKAGYTIVMAEQVLEAKYLPRGTSAQLVEL